MARAWVAPASFLGDGPLHDATIGGSYWTGNRSNTLALPNQTTQGGFTFLSFSQFNQGMPAVAEQFRQVGRQYSAAGELNAPIDHKFGARYEIVWKHNPLSIDTIASNGAGTIQAARICAATRCTASSGSGCWATIGSSATSRAWSRSRASRSSA